MKSYLDRLIAYLRTLTRVARHAEQGQGLVEYAAILTFVACVMVVAELYLAPHIMATLNQVANSF